MGGCLARALTSTLGFSAFRTFSAFGNGKTVAGTGAPDGALRARVPLERDMRGRHDVNASSVPGGIFGGAEPAEDFLSRLSKAEARDEFKQSAAGVTNARTMHPFVPRARALDLLPGGQDVIRALVQSNNEQAISERNAKQRQALQTQKVRDAELMEMAKAKRLQAMEQVRLREQQAQRAHEVRVAREKQQAAAEQSARERREQEEILQRQALILEEQRQQHATRQRALNGRRRPPTPRQNQERLPQEQLRQFLQEEESSTAVAQRAFVMQRRQREQAQEQARQQQMLQQELARRDHVLMQHRGNSESDAAHQGRSPSMRLQPSEIQHAQHMRRMQQTQQQTQQRMPTPGSRPRPTAMVARYAFDTPAPSQPRSGAPASPSGRPLSPSPRGRALMAAKAVPTRGPSASPRWSPRHGKPVPPTPPPTRGRIGC